jgi:hypothetical protein
MKINPIKQKVFKLAFRQGGELLSVSDGIRGNNLGITYIPSQVIRPRIGRIFAFDTIGAAIAFYDNNFVRKSNKECFEIWEAEGYGAKYGSLRLNVFSPELIRNFWNDTHNIINVQTVGTPFGTLFCKAIKLIKKYED